MMKSPFAKYFAMAAWLITALASTHIGLSYMGWNLISPDMMMGSWAWINYVVGIAGAISLVMFVMALTGACCKCGTECNCAGSCSCR